MNVCSSITHKNGGLEQGILEVMAEENLASISDLERLKYLKSLPQNRTEILNTYDIETKE